MSLRDVKSEVEHLREALRRHNHLYYVTDKPEISDREYDGLYRKLVDIEKAHPELITPDSPTQRVGGEITKSFPTVKHIVPMQSLDNTYSSDEIRDFDERVRKLLKSESLKYVVELKFDGVSISLLYKNGRFVLGSTRAMAKKAMTSLLI